MKLHIISPIPPSVNNYLHYKVQRTPTGRLFVQSYKSEESVIYERQFVKIAKKSINEQGWQKPEKLTYIIVDCTFFFPKHGMDTNNHWKLPLDVLKAAEAYVDDSKVLEGAKRLYIDADNPRMELTIYPAEFVGIFENQDQFESFKENNCTNCKKNPNRCAVITKSLENRLTGSIILDTMICNDKQIKYRK